MSRPTNPYPCPGCDKPTDLLACPACWRRLPRRHRGIIARAKRVSYRDHNPLNDAICEARQWWAENHTGTK